jgi:low affinity Fe/Cu permease
MSKKHRWRIGAAVESFSETVTKWVGGTGAFAIALGTIVGWAIAGPIFQYSDTWQLAINTGTTIVTFLMVFLIQRSQNKDAMAIHLKLNEIVAAMKGASNRLIDVEALTERELAALRGHYHELVSLAKQEVDLTKSHSLT